MRTSIPSLAVLLLTGHVFAAPLHARAVGDVGKPPLIPSEFPSIDQLQLIDGKFLTHPLVTDALAIVNSVVPEKLLNLPNSVFKSGAVVNYVADPVETCYWPFDGCLRKTKGEGYVEDVNTCLGQRQWAITYDDGPTSNIVNGLHVSDTSEIRQNLDSMGAKATFFMTGSYISQNPDELAKHVNSGHQMASHTWTHHPLTSLTNAQIVAEIKYTEAIIYKYTGKVVTYLRPPYGDVDDRVRAIANALGYRIALWDHISEDAVEPTEENEKTALNNIKSFYTGTSASLVSLQHDINTFTSGIAVKALKTIKSTPNFQFSLVTMASCNNHAPYSYEDGITTVLKGDWDFCTGNSQCVNKCCSNQYSNDGKYKCTPGGTVCASAIPSPLSKTTTVLRTTTTTSSRTSPPVSKTSPPVSKTSPPVSKTSPASQVTTSAKLGDWDFCTTSSQCANNCCSKQYSNDGKFKCTPGGTLSQCVNMITISSPAAKSPSPIASPIVRSPSPIVRSPSPIARLGDWAFCTTSSQCANRCCSNQYSNDGRLKCTPGGTLSRCI